MIMRSSAWLITPEASTGDLDDLLLSIVVRDASARNAE
jgi:hypothetical protein